MTNNFLPYVILQSSKFGEIRFLVDTGANKNYISPKLVPSNIIKREAKHKITNISGTHFVDKFTLINPFMDYAKSLEWQKFYLFEFHEYFHGLIGYESLRSLGAVIDTVHDILKIGSHTIPLYKKFPETININAQEIRPIVIPTSISDGDFLIEEDVEILPNMHILSGIYRSKDHKAEIFVHNSNNDSKEINLGDTFNVEVNNFELSHPEQDESAMDHSTQNELFDQLRLEHLNKEERVGLVKLISDYQQIFHLKSNKLTFTNVVKHRIDTKDNIPVYTKSYRYPYCLKEEVQSQVRDLLQQGIIRPSNSPWSSPIWVVPKKIDASGKKKWRLVVDYRKINEKTIDDKYPIPNITEVLDKLGRCNYFTTLDLASGFHQIEVHPKDISKTAFTVEHGKYEFFEDALRAQKRPIHLPEGDGQCVKRFNWESMFSIHGRYNCILNIPARTFSQSAKGIRCLAEIQFKGPTR